MTHPRTLLAGWSILLFLVLIGPWPAQLADSELFTRASSIEELSAVIARAPDSHPPTDEPLRAGVRRVSLTDRFRERSTPAEQSRLHLAGYGKRAFLAGNDGIDDPLHVTALALECDGRRVVIVSADLLIVNRVLATRTVAELARREIEIRREEILFSASHTHSGYAGYTGKMIEGISVGLYDDAVVTTLVTAFADAVEGALRSTVPANLATASKELSKGEFIANRTLPGGATDDWLDLALVRRAQDDELLASVVIFSAHATCRSGRDPHVSADYPGVLARRVEESLGGTCLFLSGAVGSMAPPEMGAPRDRWHEWLGCLLADEAIRLAHSTSAGASTCQLESRGWQLPVPGPCFKISRSWRTSPFLAGLLGSSQAFVQWVRVGDMAFLAMPADFSGELALDLRDRIPGVTTVATSFNGDYVGYILPDEHFSLRTYEPRSVVVTGPQGGAHFQRALDLLVPAPGSTNAVVAKPSPHEPR